jgi:hypothetical protein
VRAEHSFDSRARTLLEAALELRAGGRGSSAPDRPT